jgi:hypothetical protein
VAILVTTLLGIVGKVVFFPVYKLWSIDQRHTLITFLGVYFGV